MFSTVQFFDLIKAKHGLTSDYQLAKCLNISPGLISKHRSDVFGFRAELGLMIADKLNMDPAFVLLCGLVEGAKCSEEKAALMRLLFFAEIHAHQLQHGMKEKEAA